MKKVGYSLAAALVAAASLTTTTAASADAVRPAYQLCSHNGAWHVCIETQPDGWHGRGWGPDWNWTTLWNRGQRLVSTRIPPGGGGMTTSPAYSQATKACVSSGMNGTGTVYACVDTQA